LTISCQIKICKGYARASPFIISEITGSFARRFSDALGDERADGHPRRAVHQEFVFRADGFDRDCLLNKKLFQNLSK